MFEVIFLKYVVIYVCTSKIYTYIFTAAILVFSIMYMHIMNMGHCILILFKKW